MVREQTEKKQNGRKGIRSLETRVAKECCISRGKARLDSGGIRAGGGRGGSHSATVRCDDGSHSVTGKDAAGGAVPGMRAVKSLEFGEGDQ